MIQVTINFTIPSGYANGDYSMLVGDNGTGTIDYAHPLIPQQFPLFTGGNFGHPDLNAPPSTLSPSFGHGGNNTIAAVYTFNGSDGLYKFALATFDYLGNLTPGQPEIVTLNIKVPPAQPTGLKKVSYDKTNHILVLKAA